MSTLSINRFRVSKKLLFRVSLVLLFVTIIALLPHRSFAAGAQDVLETNAGIQQVWRRILSTVNMFVVLLLIVVSFAQILHLNLNTYGFKRVLPSLIMAIVAANFSYLLCRLMIDFANVFISFFIEGPQISGLTVGLNTIGAWRSPANFAEIFYNLLNIILRVIAAVMVYILAYLFLVRNWMIYFLIVLSPLAFMSTVLPQTKSVFSQWWGQYTKWVFMPVVSVFWLWLAGLWSQSLPMDGMYVQAIFAGIALMLAISTPFKMGGPAMQKWGDFGKKAWNSTGGKLTTGAKNAANNYYDTQKDHVIRRAEGSGVGRRYVALRNKGKLNRELSQEMLNKQRNDSYRATALKTFYSRSEAEWKRSAPDAYSRLKKIVGAGVQDEFGNPAYKETWDVSTLRKRVVNVERPDGTFAQASAHDMRDVNRLRKYDEATGNFRHLNADERRSYAKDNGLTMYEEHAASSRELLRRTKGRSRVDQAEAQDAINELLIPQNIDLRVMGVSSLGGGKGDELQHEVEQQLGPKAAATMRNQVISGQIGSKEQLDNYVTSTLPPDADKESRKKAQQSAARYASFLFQEKNQLAEQIFQEEQSLSVTRGTEETNRLNSGFEHLSNAIVNKRASGTDASVDTIQRELDDHRRALEGGSKEGRVAAIHGLAQLTGTPEIPAVKASSTDQEIDSAAEVVSRSADNVSRAIGAAKKISVPEGHSSLEGFIVEEQKVRDEKKGGNHMATELYVQDQPENKISPQAAKEAAAAQMVAGPIAEQVTQLVSSRVSTLSQSIDTAFQPDEEITQAVTSHVNQQFSEAGVEHSVSAQDISALIREAAKESHPERDKKPSGQLKMDFLGAGPDSPVQQMQFITSLSEKIGDQMRKVAKENKATGGVMAAVSQRPAVDTLSRTSQTTQQQQVATTAPRPPQPPKNPANPPQGL